MWDIQNIASELKRPKLLVQAARFGLDQYRREVELMRLLDCDAVPKLRDTIIRLVQFEAEANKARKEKSVYYSYEIHIQLLTALIAETQLLKTFTNACSSK